MSIDTQIEGSSVLIRVAGFFDSSCYQNFKHTSSTLLDNPDIQTIAVDLSTTQYMDSSAIGILAMLSENAKYAQKSIRLICVPGRVLEILKIAHMGRLFEIEVSSN